MAPMLAPAASRLGSGWANRSLRTKTLVVVGIPVLALLVTATTFLIVQTDETQAADLVAHTFAVEAQIERVSTLLVDSETGVRGYLLTGDRTWLAPYQAAQATLPTELTKLAALVADNPIEGERASAIRDGATHELVILGGLAATGPITVGAAATLPPELASGKTVMDGLRTDLAVMTSAESDLLATRSASSASLRSASGLITGGGVVVGLAGAILAIFLMTGGGSPGASGGWARTLRRSSRDVPRLRSHLRPTRSASWQPSSIGRSSCSSIARSSSGKRARSLSHSSPRVRC